MPEKPLHTKNRERIPEPRRFAGLPVEKALEVAEAYLDATDVAMYLRPYLTQADSSFVPIAVQLHKYTPEGIEEVELDIRKLEVKVAEAHLANIPRGYGHAAALLTLVTDKTSA